MSHASGSGRPPREQTLCLSSCLRGTKSDPINWRLKRRTKIQPGGAAQPLS
jgi:hypothetical protein